MNETKNHLYRQSLYISNYLYKSLYNIETILVEDIVLVTDLLACGSDFWHKEQVSLLFLAPFSGFVLAEKEI